MIDKAIIELEKKELEKDFPTPDNIIGRLSFGVIYSAAKDLLSRSAASLQRQSGIERDYEGILLRMFEVVCKELLYENTKKGDRS
jgi:hypothetical protein